MKLEKYFNLYLIIIAELMPLLLHETLTYFLQTYFYSFLMTLIQKTLKDMR